MTNQKDTVTADEYKLQVLKSNFASRITEYEDIIATLQTQLEMARQQIENLKGGEQGVSAPEPVEELNAPLPPPAPPAE